MLDVATPRSSQAAFTWMDTTKQLLVRPMPNPITIEAAIAQVTGRDGSSRTMSRLPAMMKRLPIMAARRLHQRQHQNRGAERHQRRAEIIDPHLSALDVLAQRDRQQDDGADTERDVEPEDHRPSRMRDQGGTDDRPEDRGTAERGGD